MGENLRKALEDLATRLCVMAYQTGRAADDLASGGAPIVDLTRVLEHLDQVDEGMAAMAGDPRVINGAPGLDQAAG